jgi:hypothetical protein
VSSHGSRLQLPGFVGTEGAHQSQTAIVASASNRQQQKRESITPDGDCCKPVYKRCDMLKHPLGKFDTGEQTQWNGVSLPSSLAQTHVSSGNKCRQPHGSQSRASKTTGARAVFVRSVSTCPLAPLFGGVLVEPRSVLHARGRTRFTWHM